MYEFVLDSLEVMNAGVADLDDELADVAAPLAWLTQAPTWINRRNPDEFDAFVDSKLMECERALGLFALDGKCTIKCSRARRLQCPSHDAGRLQSLWSDRVDEIAALVERPRQRS